MSPLQAIKKFCYECSGENHKEVTKCAAVNCALYQFRKGKNPNRKLNYTDEQREAIGERLKKSRSK